MASVVERLSELGVGQALIGGAVAGLAGQAGNAVEAGLQAAAGSAITQGIGLVTGLQDRFSWAGVAAAGVGAGVGYAVIGRAGAHGCLPLAVCRWDWQHWS